jgi:hypothetical protein
MGKRRCVNRILVGKPEGMRPLEFAGIDGMLIIKMDLQEVGFGGMD